MKFKTLFILLLMPFFVNSQIIEGGIDFGLSASQIDGDGSVGYHKLGPAISIYSSFNIKKDWSLYSGVGYVLKGAATGSKNEYFATNFNYVEIPLVIEYKPNKISFSGGIVYSYLIKGIQKTTFTIFDEDDLNLLKNELSYFMSVNYEINDKLTVRFSSNYSILPVTKYQGTILSTNVLAYYLFYHVSSSQLWWNNTLRLTLRYRILYKNGRIKDK